MTKYTTICPRCNSPDVHPDISKDMVAWGGSTNWECASCKFSSSFFPEVPIDKLDEIHLKKRKHDDIEEIMSTKGIHKGKLWGWLMVASGVLLFLVSLADFNFLIITGPFIIIQLIVGILLIRKSS